MIELVLVFAAGLAIGYLVGWNRRRLLMEGAPRSDTAGALAQQFGISEREAKALIENHGRLQAMRALQREKDL